MTRTEIEHALRAVRRAPTALATRPHADALREALAEPWIDGGLAVRIRTALDLAGAPAAWVASPLRAGETWLLLGDPATGRGEALRWRSVVGASPAAFTGECEDVLERAWRALVAMLAEAQRAPPIDFVRGGFDAPGLARMDRVDGASLGVSACIAWLSRSVGAPPPEQLAASAAVSSDGRLLGVELLAEKLAALRASAPAVRHVIVARDQRIGGEHLDGVSLLRCDTLAEAVAHCGFQFGVLPERTIEQLSERVAAFKSENARQHGVDHWRALSSEAWAVATGLARDPTERVASAQAKVWAALFALHAGDAAAARDIIVSVAAPADPALRLWKAVVDATSRIDHEQFDGAVAAVDAALRETDQLGDEHRWIEGHARGTRGRALLHAGRLVDASESLKETVGWFLEHAMPWEAARTAKDVATCVRLMGRPDDALAAIDRALAWLAEAGTRRAVSSKTRDYLRLERGRCLLAVGRPLDAVPDFEDVVHAQSKDHDYPRLGGVRGLAVANRRGGRTVESRAMLDRCRLVALACVPGSVLGRVAAAAAGEALIDGDDEGLESMREAWLMHNPGLTDVASIREAVQRQVY